MKKLILANLKSNKSVEVTRLWFETLLKSARGIDFSRAEVSVAPQMAAVSLVEKMVESAVGDLDYGNASQISLAIQDISSFPAGSYTGAISGQNLNGLKIKYAIVGHSERRKYFAETSRDVALKVEQSLANNITPVLCVDTEYLDEQLGLINKEDLAKCVVAYEPLSAIGSGKNADVGTVKEVVEKVRRLAGDVRVLYGGSVDEFNINEYLLVSDGVLIGTACLDEKQFARVIEVVTR